ncbi:MAG: hypothetical protein H7321_00190 [Bacteroidia bacterium]|nr:hypothetical protein [Bacteroidia bacterium]
MGNDKKDKNQYDAEDYIKVLKQSKVDSDFEYSSQRDTFLLGDINNDGINDTGYLDYSQKISLDSGAILKNYSKCSDMTVTFSSGIKDLEIEVTDGLFIEKAPDLNGDGSNDIIIYSYWVTGYWYQMHAYSFNNNKWNRLAQVKVFIDDDKSTENRIVKKNNKYYLAGDKWNKDFSEILFRSDLVKIIPE